MNPIIPSLNINSIFSKNNYDRDSVENEDFINISKKINIEEKPEINRISNLKDNELPLEDKLQIQKQINDANDNDNDDQIEVIENILNNFGKEKFKEKKFLMYKYKYKSSLKKKYKSNSVINSNNKILNKIKNDIALINFQQEINKIHKLHNYKIFLKSERAHLNTIKKNNIENNNLNQENKNIKRIEEIKKKLFSKNEQKNDNKQNNIKKLINNFNLNRKKENLFHSQNEKAFNQILEEINNLKQSKINNNNNFNNLNNNNNIVCNTFRSGINPLINSPRKKNYLDDNEDYLKTEESTKTSLINSNQFFYNVYKNSIHKYPYLHILKNKINKMKKFDLSQSQKKFQARNRTNNKITLLEKINSQKDIFQKEIEQYNSK